MKRGSVYWVNLEPNILPEFGKVRPGIILSNSEHNLRLPTVVIIPLSSRAPEIWPLRIPVKLPRHKTSYAVIPGIRQVSKTRLKEMIGIISQETLEVLDHAVGVYLKD